MTLSDKMHKDLLKRVEQMNLDECGRMLDNMPPNIGAIDQAIIGMIEERIEQLRQEGAEECE